MTRLILDGKEKDLGGFSVRRVLPSAKQRMVGPFIFFDHLGPATFAPGEGIDVRPHPHIGLSTVTYLFEGALMHRDSLGNITEIKPGAVNWMTAGNGIVHSERSPEEERAAGHTLHALQIWIALPDQHEEVPASFGHYAASDLPEKKENGIAIKLIAGKAYGMEAPVKTFSPMFYVDVLMQKGKTLELTDAYSERALYVVEGEVQYNDNIAAPHQMIIFNEGDSITLTASKQSRFMLLGGEPVGERHIWWNFVSSSKERIEQAKTDWVARNFPEVPEEDEFIPLPDHS